MLLKPIYADGLVSNFGCKFNLRRYSMMPSEWAAMLQRAHLHLPQQNYEALLDELYAGIVGKRGGGGAMPRRRHTEEDRRLLREICTWAGAYTRSLFGST